MVYNVEGYMCAYCGNKYEKYDDAYKCAIDCALIEDPEPTQLFKCDMCGETYPEIKDADECEKRHERNMDKNYFKFLEEESRRKLMAAGEHPAQLKLGDGNGY